MKIPEEVRRPLTELLWDRADSLGWSSLSPVAKSKHYDQWARDDEVGGVLGRYMPVGDIRMYLKNSLMGGYARAKLSDPTRPLRVLRVNGTEIEEQFEKPHGCRLLDGRVIAWGRAKTWRAILLAVYERAYRRNSATPFGVVFFNATGKFHQQPTRDMIEDAAGKLGIERVEWLTT